MLRRKKIPKTSNVLKALLLHVWKQSIADMSRTQALLDRIFPLPPRCLHPNDPVANIVAILGSIKDAYTGAGRLEEPAIDKNSKCIFDGATDAASLHIF
jgi:hypothetical protein